jgi:hypothetical protein
MLRGTAKFGAVILYLRVFFLQKLSLVRDDLTGIKMVK